MGWLSDRWKGVKKVFKKIGRGIKKVAGKVGKFMNKIGIVGQIALAFILPGVGNMLASTLGNLGTWAATAGGNFLTQGVKSIVGMASKFITTGARIFNTVGSGIKNFVGEFGKTLFNKIPGLNIEGAATNFFGTGGAFEKAAGATAETWNSTIGSSSWWEQFESPTEKALGSLTAPDNDLDMLTKDKPPSIYDEVIGDPSHVAPDILAQTTVTPDSNLAFMDESSLMTPPSIDIPDYALPDKEPSFLQKLMGRTEDYNITGEMMADAGKDALKYAATSLLSPQQEEEPYYGGRGGYGMVLPVNQIGGAEMMPMPSMVGYGFNQQQIDNIYRPQGIWSRRMS